MKTSIIFETDRDVLQRLFDESGSKSEILLKLGCSPSSGAMREKLNKRIEVGDIDLTLFNYNHQIMIREKNKRISITIPLDDILVEKSTYTNISCLKQRLIKENLLKYECAFCGNNGFWNNNPLTLQLDHINGKHNDHRLHNLRLLCPNCHSQTNTYAGRNSNTGIYKD